MRWHPHLVIQLRGAASGRGEGVLVRLAQRAGLLEVPREGGLGVRGVVEPLAHVGQLVVRFAQQRLELGRRFTGLGGILDG